MPHVRMLQSSPAIIRYPPPPSAVYHNMKNFSVYYSLINSLILLETEISSMKEESVVERLVTNKPM